MCWLNLFYYLLAIGGAFVFSRSYIGWFGEYLLWAVLLLPPMLTLLSIPSMRALRIRCAAPKAVNLGEEAELDAAPDWFVSGWVTGKASSMGVTGGATVYTCYDKDGLPLASFEFYDGLLVRSDGMYYVK